jgi:hypothetical protein
LSIIPESLKLPQVPDAYNEKENEASHVQALRDTKQNPMIPRIDLYQKLLDLYESERLRWEQFKISARPADNAPAAQYFDYDRKLPVLSNLLVFSVDLECRTAYELCASNRC